MSRRVRGIDDEDSEDELPEAQVEEEKDASGSENDRDSSEEEDDNEEELAKLKEEFIDDEEAEGSDDEPQRKRRRRIRREKDDELDEDDLDLVREASGRKYRRLQRSGGQGLASMFDDEEDAQEQDQEQAGDRDDLDDFIEHDQLSDEDEPAQRRPVVKRATPGDLAAQLDGLDHDKLEEIYEVFGDGGMYDWALEGEDEEQVPEEQLTLTDVFEPGELKARMLTEEDNVIRSVDIPERYQALREHLKFEYDLDGEDFAAKIEWVAAQLKKDKLPLITTRPELEEPIITAIGDVVKFIAKDNYEVPFIWSHRQDYIRLQDSQLLSREDLWRILALDLEYHNLREKRAALKELWQSLETESQVFDELFAQANTIVELQDLLEWVQYHYASTLKDRAAEKRRSRFSGYDRIRASSIWTEFAEQSGISPENFGRNLQAGSKIYADNTCNEPLNELAETCGDIDSTLTQAVDILSMDMSQDPRVRRFYRKAFEQEARIDIVLTEDGKKKIDDNSPFFDIKYATNWSFEELLARPEFYLRMHEAESQGLVIVRVQYPDYKSTLFEEVLKDYFSANEDQPDLEQWNDFRRRILKATSRRVVPLVCRNIRESLRTGCLDQLVREVRKNFTLTLDQAPYKPPELDAGVVPRVFALSPGMGMLGKDAVLGVCLDEDGVLIESVKFNDPRSADFGPELAKVVKRSLPDVIGIAGFTVATNRVKHLVEQAVKDQNLVSGETEVPIEVLWVQDEVARVYRNTERAKAEYSELPPLAHYCVGLARYLQSPLYEYAALGDEIYSLQLHPSQYLLPREYLKQAVESVFVDMVNLVGIDINQAVRHQSIGNVVQYVCGLGRRKASSLLSALQNKDPINRRDNLVTLQLMGKTVFFNCCSFFRVESLDDPELLDTTRIHPEDYVYARKLAADALQIDEEDIREYEETIPGGVISKLFEDDPGKLDELVLPEYAKQVEEADGRRVLYTLHQICSELKSPSRELRPKFKPPTDGQVFTMLTGETKQTLRPDVVTTATVNRANNKQMTLTLSCGVDAIAEQGNITDERGQPIGQLFTPGQAVQAAVVNVDYRGFFVAVNTKASVVKETMHRERKLKKFTDPNKWDSEAERRDARQVQHRMEAEQRQSRIIKHPLFQPFSSKQAEEHLAAMQRGDLVIRPSSRGNDHIVITWKVGDMLYQHVDILELEKPNDYSIGKFLQVGRFRYSDLDELIIMHIQAMARKIDEMTQSDKFREGSRADVDKWLTAYTNARPKQSVYAFCFDHKRPGYFLLCFKLAANHPTKEWHVKVTPAGYELMGKTYADVPALCNGFKMAFQSMRR